MKTILLCGATGFIGKNLLDHYSSNSNYKIKAVYNNRKPYKSLKNVEWVKCDLRDQKQIKQVMKND